MKNNVKNKKTIYKMLKKVKTNNIFKYPDCLKDKDIVIRNFFNFAKSFVRFQKALIEIKIRKSLDTLQLR